MSEPSAARDSNQLLANGLAHKIRNSLNAMRAHLALLQKFCGSPADGRVLQQVQRLEQAVGVVDDLLKDYLALASPERGEWQEVQPEALVREVVRFAALDLEQAKVAVVEEFAAGLPAVYVDGNKLKRVILALVVNARQAMPGGGHLTVRAKPVGHSGVALEFADTGHGIAAEERRHVFEPFFSTKPGAVGLSLAVARRTVRDLGGRITFESGADAGTTFRITLPTAARRRASLERQAARRQWLQPTA